MKRFLCLILISCVFISPVLSKNIIKLATTTSTDNSGLLKILLPPFEKKYNARVDVIAVGTGKAIKLGENGDVDAILVHARKAEDKFVDDGYGANRREVMFNDFVILGPKNDPAKAKGSEDIVAVFKNIARQTAPFVSRGDDSGTHKKEVIIWKKSKIEPKGKWYNAIGQGMGAALQIANEKQAYVLADRGTYLAYKNKLDLIVIYQWDKFLHNPYSVIAVNPARHKHVNYTGAMLLTGWLTSVKGQEIIKKYQVNGKRLFNPLAIK